MINREKLLSEFIYGLQRTQQEVVFCSFPRIKFLLGDDAEKLAHNKTSLSQTRTKSKRLSKAVLEEGPSTNEGMAAFMRDDLLYHLQMAAEDLTYEAAEELYGNQL